MADRSGSESTEHAELITMMVAHFKGLGYSDIRADISGYTQPDQVGGHIPDLSCKKNDAARTRITLEAETCETIGDDHTASQWRAFASASGEFHLVVPKSCGTESGRSKAQRRLRELGLSADEIWARQ